MAIFRKNAASEFLSRGVSLFTVDKTAYAGQPAAWAASFCFPWPKWLLRILSSRGNVEIHVAFVDQFGACVDKHWIW